MWKNFNDALIGRSGVRKGFLKKEHKKVLSLARGCENVRMGGWREEEMSGLKTHRWADKHNQDEGMSTGVSAEAGRVFWMCSGWGRAGSEHMVWVLRKPPSVHEWTLQCVRLCVRLSSRAGGWVAVSLAHLCSSRRWGTSHSSLILGTGSGVSGPLLSHVKSLWLTAFTVD